MGFPAVVMNLLVLPKCQVDRLCFQINVINTVEPVHIEPSRQMKKCSMYAGVQHIQIQSILRSDEKEKRSKVNR